MRIQTVDKQNQLSDALYERIEKKVGKLSRYFPEETEVQLCFKLEKGNTCICEVTIPFYGEILRAEERTDDMYTSIDRALAKIERQIHKNRKRFEKRMRGGAFDAKLPEYAFSAYHEETFIPQLVRTKTFPIDPMSVEEAMDTLELLGHTFFIFRNINNNEINVVYKRNDGNYGLIMPQ